MNMLKYQYKHNILIHSFYALWSTYHTKWINKFMDYLDFALLWACTGLKTIGIMVWDEFM